MAILLDETTEVVVQGATGKEGQFRIQRARECRAVVIGPNSIGVVSPGKAIIGVIGGRMELMRTAFRPGPCGVLSRSGGQTTTLCYYLTKAGVGQSTAIGVGGDAFVGASWSELLPLFERDPETRMVALFGEIGTTNEGDAAALIQAGGFTKPVVAYVSGRYARPGMRFGHAGAIISRGIGTAEAKIAALRDAGVQVVEHLGDIGPAARRILAHLHLLPPGDGSRAPPTEAGSGLPVRCRTETGAPAGVGLRELIYEPVYDLPAASACLPSLGDRQAQAATPLGRARVTPVLPSARCSPGTEPDPSPLVYIP